MMQIQPFNAKKHEVDLRESRYERRSEDLKLATLKTRVQDALGQKQPSLFAVHPDGRVNAA
jgi:hypothetical protein